MQSIPHLNKWYLSFTLSLTLALLVNLLYYPYGIILPIIGNPTTQLLWFLGFFILGTKQLFSEKITTFSKISQVVMLIIIAIPIQFVNLLGGIATVTEPTTAVLKCSDYPIYSRHYTNGGTPEIDVYTSYAPLIYLLPIKSHGGYIGHDDELKAEVGDFKSSDKFNKFTSCINFKYNKVLICKNLYYATNLLKPNQAGYDDKMPENINDYTEPTLQARFYHENKLACQK